LLDDVRVDTVDLVRGIGGDVAVAVKLAGGVDFLVAESGEVGWGCGFGGAVAVAVEPGVKCQ